MSISKFYKKINWLINGVIIGVIVAGMVERTFNTLVIGASIGVIGAVLFKAAGWWRRQQSGL